MNLVYLNGDYLPLADAKISVLDRGFLFGDAVYEVIPAYGGCLFRLPEHLQRLNNSLAAVRIENPLDDGAWETILKRLIDQAPGQNQSVYLQVSRGAADKRDHAIPNPPLSPTVFVMSHPITAPDPAMAAAGISVITLDDIRWRYCNVKATTLLANVLLKQQALEQAATEAILVREGEVTEGAATNLFVILDGKILTPPKSQYLLPGITRDLVLELADKADLPCGEAKILATDLDRAEEIWLTSSTREVMPVTRLNERPVADGKPGPLWHKMSDLYQAYKKDLISCAES